MVKGFGFSRHFYVLTLIFMLLLMLFVSGCMRPKSLICDHDGICTDDETDNCADCKNVIGRGIPIPVSVQETNDLDSESGEV